MKKTITIRIHEKFLDKLDEAIKKSNDIYDQAFVLSDFDTLGRFDRIRKYADRSDFIECALYEIYLELNYEINHFNEDNL